MSNSGTFNTTAANSTNTTAVVDDDFYDKTMDKVLAVIYFSMAVSVLILNSLEAYLMVRLRKERSVTTVFTFSLTLTDIIMGSLGIPFSAIAITQDRNWIFGDVMCNITGFFVNTCIFTALLSICLVTVNRYLALITPIKYQIFMTFRASKIAVGMVWFVGCLRSSIPFFFGQGYTYYKSTICGWSTHDLFGPKNELPYFLILLVLPFCLTFSIIVCCSIHMVVALIRRMSRFGYSILYSKRSSRGSLSKRGSSGGKSAGDKEREAVITTFLIIIAFILSYFCYYFSLIVYLFDGFGSWSDTQYLYLEVMMILTIYMNSFFNPILYIIRNTKYRKELNLIKTQFYNSFKIFKCGVGVPRSEVRFTNADLSTCRTQETRFKDI